MSENEKNVPKRRFKEFENVEAWEQRKLGNIVAIRSGRDYKHLSEGDIPVYGTGGYMLSVNEALSYKEDAIGIGRKGTIDKPYILKAPFWTVDTLFYAVSDTNNDLDFIYDIFQNINWKQKDESTGIPSLSKTAINEIDVLIPEYKEQKQIGNFFQHIDNLITLHQCKLEKTKALKKAYLADMFPAERERKPKLRFAGFTNDWEQRKFSDIFNLSQGLQIEISKRFVNPGENMYFYITNEFLKSGSNEMYYIYNPPVSVLCDESDILMTRTGNTGVVVTDVKGCFHNNFFKIKYDPNNYDKYFICQYLSTPNMQKKILNSAGSSTIPDLSHKSFYRLLGNFPDIIEQKRISDFLINLDNLITLHQHKLEKLQNIKKAYLNEMFI